VVWLALDDVDKENACVEVIPGSHTRLVGDFSKRIRAELVEQGVVTQADLDRAVAMPLKKGEFFMFHAWVLDSTCASRPPAMSTTMTSSTCRFSAGKCRKAIGYSKRNPGRPDSAARRLTR
jgi:ectoine hydroxylase-related dioxygenase (phytanoyl-CoA dioxygenase family)